MASIASGDVRPESPAVAMVWIVATVATVSASFHVQRRPL